MNKRKKENERMGVDRHTDRYIRGEWESKVWGAKKIDDKRAGNSRGEII